MAITGYLSRVIVKEHTDNETTFAGTYKLLLAAKSIPAPAGNPNPVESTSLEDDAQTFVEGIRQVDQKEITGNLEKAYVTALKAYKGKKLDVMHLYGMDGLGSESIWAYSGTVTYSVNDIGGVDEIVEMTATITPNTVSEEVTGTYTVAAGTDSGTFTVTKAS